MAEHLHEVPVLILCCLQHDGSAGLRARDQGEARHPGERGHGGAAPAGLPGRAESLWAHESPGRRGRDIRGEVGPAVGDQAMTPRGARRTDMSRLTRRDVVKLGSAAATLAVGFPAVLGAQPKDVVMLGLWSFTGAFSDVGPVLDRGM